MARKRDKRSLLSKTVEKVPDNYEGDDEAKDDESPPASPSRTAEKEEQPEVKSTDAAAPTEHVDDDKPSKDATGDSSDGEYEVEEIVGMEVNLRWKCPVKFRVRWVGFGEKDDTWQHANFLSCDTFVQDFLQISGRKSEYEKAMDRASRKAKKTVCLRETLRRGTKGNGVDYYEDESDDDSHMVSNKTRTRDARPPQLFEPNSAATKLKKKRKMTASQNQKAGVSRAEVLANQAGREYEVVDIVDHRTRGRLTDYKVRWKGLSASHDSWVPETNLTCPKLIKEYNKNKTTESDQEYEKPLKRKSGASLEGEGESEEISDKGEEDEYCPPAKKKKKNGRVTKAEEDEEVNESSPPAKKRGGRVNKVQVEEEELDETSPAKRSGRISKGGEEEEVDEPVDQPSPLAKKKTGRVIKADEKLDEPSTPVKKNTGRVSMAAAEEEEVVDEDESSPTASKKNGRVSKEEEEEEIDIKEDKVDEPSPPAKNKRNNRGRQSSRSKLSKARPGDSDEEEAEESSTPKKASKGSTSRTSRQRRSTGRSSYNDSD